MLGNGRWQNEGMWKWETEPEGLKGKAVERGGESGSAPSPGLRAVTPGGRPKGNAAKCEKLQKSQESVEATAHIIRTEREHTAWFRGAGADGKDEDEPLQGSDSTNSDTRQTDEKYAGTGILYEQLERKSRRLAVGSSRRRGQERQARLCPRPPSPVWSWVGLPPFPEPQFSPPAK